MTEPVERVGVRCAVCGRAVWDTDVDERGACVLCVAEPKPEPETDYLTPERAPEAYTVTVDPGFSLKPPRGAAT